MTIVIHLILFLIEYITYAIIKGKIKKAEEIIETQAYVIKQLTKKVCQNQRGMTKKELNCFINKLTYAATKGRDTWEYEVDQEKKRLYERCKL